MNKFEIGCNAGILFHLISDNRDWSYEELKSASGLRDRDLNAAIGWLARENKIEVECPAGGNNAEKYHSPHYNRYY